MAVGGIWNTFNVGTLAETFSDTFGVLNGFSAQRDDVWTAGARHGQTR